VVGKDMQTNTLIVEQGEQHPALYSIGLRAEQIHWTADEPPPLPLDCLAKTRYRQEDQVCRVLASSNPGVIVQFAQAQRAVTPGQSVVFYADDVCLGGGTIVATEPATPAAENVLSRLVKSY
jgi:tRNA-specific 2-thiouridylase